MFRLILAAVDESPLASRVLDMAEVLALRFDAEVKVLRVVNLPPEFPPAAHAHEDHLSAVLAKQAGEDLAALIHERARMSALPPVLTGVEAWHVVVESADTVNADLVVIGSHGFRGWDHLLGTNAAKIVDHATRHVFVVHTTPPEASSPQ